MDQPTAQKVTITGDVGMGMKVAHTFERVVDNAEQAEQFGQDANTLFTSFQNGFSENKD